MNEIMIKDNIKIENYIYEVRGQRVMLDSDLAMFFEYETKQLNRQVARNIKIFPENYCFQLTESEYENLRCQFGTSSEGNNYGGRRYLPYVFTEHGVTMLAGVLKNDLAIKMSLKIVDAFVKMKNYLSNSLVEQNFYKNMLLDLGASSDFGLSPLILASALLSAEAAASLIDSSSRRFSTSLDGSGYCPTRTCL